MRWRQPFPGTDAAIRFSWPVAEGYGVDADRVRAMIRDARGRPMGLKHYDKPLLDPDLFSSLGRTAADGDPSEAKILRWIGKHGLLTCEHEYEAGDPISVHDFRAEARRAHDALTLFASIRDERHGELRERITVRRARPPARPGAPPDRFVNTLVDGMESGTMLSADRGLSDEAAPAALSKEDVVRVAIGALETTVQARVEGRLVFGADFGHRNPLSNYRPALSWMPRDLVSAAWYQFALEMSDLREHRFCEGCGLPFLLRRNDQRVCRGSWACRKARQRKRNA